MTQIAEVKITEVAAHGAARAGDFPNRTCRVRVSPHNYFIGVFLATFFAGFWVYLEKDFVAVAFLAFGWILLPFLAWFDHIVFDGEKLTRTGFVPGLWARLNRRRRELGISEIEQVETYAYRALKRGGNVFYRYRTTVHGRGLRFAFASSGEDYRRMVQKLFSTVSADALDNRSSELRDYLREPKETLMKAEFERIPSNDVLESSINELNEPDRNLRIKRVKRAVGSEEIEKSEYLRRLANELRLSGNLLRSLEAFRRALLLNPSDAWLVFEFARCLHSYASVEQNKKLQRKAAAALRLAESRAGKDGELLSRLGESYFQYGEWERARAAFSKALGAAEESFRAVRGLAEIALREGKIAHVIHHFASAMHFAENNALRSWAQGENEYFNRLNTDDDYMESEIKRLNRLENIERGKRTSLQIALAGIFLIIFGLVLNPTLAAVGWTCATISLLIWTGLIMSKNLLAHRNPATEED